MSEKPSLARASDLKALTTTFLAVTDHLEKEGRDVRVFKVVSRDLQSGDPFMTAQARLAAQALLQRCRRYWH